MIDLQLHITADKREIKDFPKLPSTTSFNRETLYEIPNPDFENERCLYRKWMRKKSKRDEKLGHILKKLNAKCK